MANDKEKKPKKPKKDEVTYMSVGYLKWLATRNVFLGNTPIQAGDIILSQANPDSSAFTQYTADTTRPFCGSKVDLDGTWYHGKTGWEDFRLPITSGKLGANAKPDFDYTNNGYLFPNNDTGEVLYMSDQLPHSADLGPGAVGHPHLHVVQAADQQAVFKFKYRITGNGSAVPAFATLTSTGYIYTYVSGSLLQILEFPAIDLSQVSLSSIIDVQLWRDDSAYTGDILVKACDIHIPINSLGSGQEFIK